MEEVSNELNFEFGAKWQRWVKVDQVKLYDTVNNSLYQCGSMTQ